MKIILSRTDDWQSHSKGWVVGYSLLFWLTTKILAVLLVLACTWVYKDIGFSKSALPVYNDIPQGVNNIDKLLITLASVAFITPILQEIVFRLGLSFKKWQVALALSCIPVFIAWMSKDSLSWVSATIYLIAALAINFVIWRFTTQEFWDRLQKNGLIKAMWITSTAYGLVHLFEFSFFSWSMLPYMLCLTLTPFFCGCACAYLRVNLGFWWGFGMHLFGNIPGIFAILLMSIH